MMQIVSKIVVLGYTSVLLQYPYALWHLNVDDGRGGSFYSWISTISGHSLQRSPDFGISCQSKRERGWSYGAERYGDRVALLDPYHNPASKITYKQLEQSILNFCEGLRAIGIKPDEKIALFSDNSCRWLVADQALVVDNPELFNRIIETFRSKASMRCIILLWGENSSLAAEGLDAINLDDIATLIYTSSTAGYPKAVMLTHRNLLHQIKNLWDVIPAKVGDKFLSMLPPWHAYERACEYFIFTLGVEQTLLGFCSIGVIIVPNKGQLLSATSYLSNETLTNLIYSELRKWTSECSFQIRPILIVNEPFTMDNGLLSPTMKVRRHNVTAYYKKETENLFKAI
ncbi:Long-chain-fatty-acid--[acyl-carrier-protein] ligase AEE15, chloroplastic, partial [Cucurbita argyrosperma subsp. sororia]